jgi:anti-sigma B factor antagonist
MSSLATFRVTIEPVGDSCVMRAVGEIDMATAPALRDQLAAARADRLTTLLDLSGVSFIDSSGLHVLLDGARWVDEDQWALFIVRPSAAVQRLLEVSGTFEILPMVRAEVDGEPPSRALRADATRPDFGLRSTAGSARAGTSA